MNIYVIRHGETDWNTVKRLQGTTDIPLNQNGIQMAEQTSNGLNKEGIKFDLIYSSPLIRAYKTAQIMAQQSNCPIIKDERLREFNFGEAEGHTLDELKADPKYQNLVYWFTESSKYKAELGAESLESLFDRIDSFFNDKVLPFEDKYENILLVVHGGVVRGVTNYLTKEGIAGFCKVKIPNCGVNLFTLKNGKYDVQYIGKTFY